MTEKPKYEVTFRVEGNFTVTVDAFDFDSAEAAAMEYVKDTELDKYNILMIKRTDENF